MAQNQAATLFGGRQQLLQVIHGILLLHAPTRPIRATSDVFGRPDLRGLEHRYFLGYLVLNLRLPHAHTRDRCAVHEY